MLLIQCPCGMCNGTYEGDLAKTPSNGGQGARVSHPLYPVKASSGAEDLGQTHTGSMISVSPLESWSVDSVGCVLPF